MGWNSRNVLRSVCIKWIVAADEWQNVLLTAENVLKQQKNVLRIVCIKCVETADECTETNEKYTKADVCAETADKFTKAIKQVDMNMLKQQIMCWDLCE